MTASPRDDRMANSVHVDSAHLTALPASPLAAYALGMLHMLQRASVAAECAPAACEAMRESDAVARHVLAFLDDPRVPLSEKRALVVAIEHAVDVADVSRVLHLHAIANGQAEELQHRKSDAADTAISTCTDIGVCAEEATTTSPVIPQEVFVKDELIPEALGCTICCDELMLKPVSLLCGHSFCKRCVDMWLKSCNNCPTCRQPVNATTAVNVALLELMTAFFPEKLKQLADRDTVARVDGLRALIAQSIASGQSIREVVAQQQTQPGDNSDQHATQAEVSHLLESDPTLQQQVLAAEIRERLRKEKALREASRRRHIVAYCGTLPAAARAHVQLIHTSSNGTTNGNASSVPAPTPSVQSHRPVKKYVPPPPKKSAFFGNLLRRLHNDHASTETR